MSMADQPESNEIRANAAISRFLDYYVDPKRPFDYAVMVNGPWGSGKTHLVKEFMKDRTDPEPLYVTLNGISSAEQIDQEFYRQLHPILSSRGMRVAFAAVRSMAKVTFKVDLPDKENGTLNVSLPQIDLTKDLANPGGRLLIFDDLERCKIPVNEVLGYINSFVEHDGLKVIILANEVEIREKVDRRYDQIREKLIGQTLTVSSPAAEVFDAFVSQIGHESTKEFLRRHREAVLALHTQGGRGNLRTLKHAMWDFEKIGSQLEERHWSKEESVLKILKGVTAVSMEYRAGVLNEDNLGALFGSRIRRLMRGAAQTEKSDVDLICDRYPQVDFGDVLFGAPMLGSILLRGEMDASRLLAELDATSDYAEPGKQPLWLQALNAFTCDDATCERIAEAVESAFAARKFTVRGEFLQIAGIRLWFADIRLISKEREELVADCQAYIDDLAHDDRLETSLDNPKKTGRINSYFGYDIMQSDSHEHKKIAEYYDMSAQNQEEKRYPQIARDLLAKLPVDPDGFLFDLAPNFVKGGRYLCHPVLATLPPAEYAKTVFEAPPKIQSRAIETLHSRHDGRTESSLQCERPWIAKVKVELEKLMATAKPMTRFRLQSLIARNLNPLIPVDREDRDSGDNAVH